MYLLALEYSHVLEVFHFKLIDNFAFNKKILKINDTFKPDLIVIGHADNIKDQTFLSLKNSNKNLKLAQWFLDPVSKKGPDYLKNKYRLTSKSKFMDCSFLTTSPEALDFKINNSFFIPNPSDHSFETLNNFKKNPENDLFFAMSHGVHRGVLKKGKQDKRESFLKKLIKISSEQIKFDLYGFSNRQPVWGDDFINVISNSKMGLNLSRGEPLKYYSSDRIAQLFGNGLLTFLVLFILSLFSSKGAMTTSSCFEDDFSSPSTLKRIQHDAQTAKDSHVETAPAIFINGNRQQTLSMRFVQDLIASDGNISG
mgnify:CR=1 FL=1